MLLNSSVVPMKYRLVAYEMMVELRYDSKFSRYKLVLGEDFSITVFDRARMY